MRAFAGILIAVVTRLILAPVPAGAQPCGENACTSIVMHAVDSGFAPCDLGDVDCVSVLPTVDITGFESPAILVTLRNYDDVAGVQCAFDPPSTWSFGFGLWDCQSNQLTATVPAPPFGPINGTITTAFDAIEGGALALIGRLHFTGAGDGCLEIIDSAYPEATHVVDSAFQSTPIPDSSDYRGRVCVGPGGHGACFPTPVEPASWGAVKADYR